MKALLENLKAARLALLALLIAAVLSMLLVHYALQAKQAAQQRLGQLQMALDEAQRKLSQSGSEKDLVQQYLDAYHTLQQRGFIGPDQRLAWRDALADAGRRLAIGDLKFSIGPQQTYTGVVPVDVGKMVLHEAPVNLTGQIFDENDLARLIDILASQPGGILGVRDCTLQRSNTQLSSPVEPQLQTQCNLVWYTLSPTAPGGSAP
ncbi:MAG TPA: hypothetical protein VMV97_05335 [Sulfuriferula sp.]|nr:hypothetical protein [Sulfuriferula sp.]